MKYGFIEIDVLECLRGRPYDEIAKAFISALRPSDIRIIHNSEVHCDSFVWRVSVYLDKNQKIESIKQEVKCELPDNINNGYELKKALNND